jgi:hypothetical protein
MSLSCHTLIPLAQIKSHFRDHPYTLQKEDTLNDSALSASLNESEGQVSADEALRADTRRREIGEQLQALSQQLDSHEQYAKSLQQNDETFAVLRVSAGRGRGFYGVR